jgi:hypothetical protein
MRDSPHHPSDTFIPEQAPPPAVHQVLHNPLPYPRDDPVPYPLDPVPYPLKEPTIHFPEIPTPLPVPRGPQDFHRELGAQYQFQYSQCNGKKKVFGLVTSLPR